MNAFDSIRFDATRRHRATTRATTSDERRSMRKKFIDVSRALASETGTR
jgi:hypothetical protein